MKKRRKFNLFRQLNRTVVALLVMCLGACDSNDQWMMGDIPGNNQMASYSNKLSAPIGGNELILHYNGDLIIGKEVKFGKDQEGKGILTLGWVLPGQAEYTINKISLTPAETGYTFEGSAAGNTGITFKYKGNVEQKKLTLRLSEVTVPENPLTGRWYILPNNGEECDSSRNQNGQSLQWYTACHTIYTQAGEFTAEDGEALLDPEKILSIVPLAFNLAVNPILSCVVSSVLKDVTFQEDGNITATYAGFPDTLSFTQMLSGKGVIRNESDWKTSPSNLITYYPLDGNTICVMPNVDMIIRQIETNKAIRTKASASPEIIGGILGIYMQLNQWGARGIKLHLTENNPGKYTWSPEGKYLKQEGNYIVYIDKSEIEAFFAILDIAKALIPAEIIGLPLDQLLLANGVDVEQIIRETLGEQFVSIIVPVLHKFTIDNLLAQIKADLNKNPLQLGLWLSNVQIPVKQN